MKKKKEVIIIGFILLTLMTVFVSGEEDSPVSNIQNYVQEYNSGQIDFPQFLSYSLYEFQKMEDSNDAIEFSREEFKSLFNLNDAEMSALFTGAFDLGIKEINSDLNYNYLNYLGKNQKLDEIINKQIFLFNDKRIVSTAELDKTFDEVGFLYSEYFGFGKEGTYFGKIIPIDDSSSILIYSKMEIIAGRYIIGKEIVSRIKIIPRYAFLIIPTNFPVKYAGDSKELNGLSCENKMSMAINLRKSIQKNLDDDFVKWLLNDFYDFTNADSNLINKITYELLYNLKEINEEIQLIEIDTQCLENSLGKSPVEWPSEFSKINVDYTKGDGSYIKIFEKEIPNENLEWIGYKKFNSYWTTYYDFGILWSRNSYLKWISDTLDSLENSFKGTYGAQGTQNSGVLYDSINAISKDYDGSFETKVIFDDDYGNILMERYVQINPTVVFGVEESSHIEPDVTLEFNTDKMHRDITKYLLESRKKLSALAKDESYYYETNSWGKSDTNDVDYQNYLKALYEESRKQEMKIILLIYNFFVGDNISIKPRMSIPKFILTANKVYSLVGKLQSI